MANRRAGAHALQAFVEENHARVRLENELNTRKAELESGTLEREKGRGREGERERGNASWGDASSVRVREVLLGCGGEGVPG